MNGSGTNPDSRSNEPNVAAALGSRPSGGGGSVVVVVVDVVVEVVVVEVVVVEVVVEVEAVVVVDVEATVSGGAVVCTTVDWESGSVGLVAKIPPSSPLPHAPVTSTSAAPRATSRRLVGLMVPGWRRAAVSPPSPQR